MKKALVLMVLVLIALSPLFARGEGEEAAAGEQKYVIGISQPTFNHPIRQAHFWAAEIWSQTHPNVEFIFMDGRKEAAKQIADIEGWGYQHIALACCSVDGLGQVKLLLRGSFQHSGCELNFWSYPDGIPASGGV